MAMKKIAAVLLLLALLGTAAACGKETATNGSGEGAGSAPVQAEGGGNSSEAAVTVDADALVRGICEKYELTNGFIFTSSSTELGEYLDEDLIQSYYGDATDAPDFSKVADYCLYVDERTEKVR